MCHVHTLQAVGRTERTVLCIAIELNIVYFRHIKLVQFTSIGLYSNLQMCTRHAVGRNDRAISHSRVAVHIRLFYTVLFFIRLTHGPAFYNCCVVLRWPHTGYFVSAFS